MTSSPRSTLAAGFALVGLLCSSEVLAYPSVTLSADGPLTYNTSQSNQTLTVNFNVMLGSGDTVDQVMTQFSGFVAYDPAVLKYKSVTPIAYGPALSSSTGDPERPSLNSLSDMSYTVLNPPFALDAGITGVGTPIQESDYVDGSLLVGMVIDNQTGFVINDLYLRQQPGALLFTIVFDVVTTQSGHSAILLLNDTSFDPDITPETFDSKYWNDGSQAAFYPVSNGLNVTVNDAPAPTPLVLIVTGLIGMAVRRRRLH